MVVTDAAKVFAGLYRNQASWFVTCAVENDKTIVVYVTNLRYVPVLKTFEHHPIEFRKMSRPKPLGTRGRK